MHQKTAVLVFIFVSLFFIRGTSDQVTQAPQTPTILITEVAYDTWREDSLNEWVELLILSDDPITGDDAKQIKLGDEEEIGGGEGMVRFPKDTILEPNQVIVIAQSAADFWAVYGIYPSFELIDSTADVPDMIRFSLLAKGDIAFANSGDEVILLDAKNQPIDQVSYGESTTYLEPAIDPVQAGHSLERYPPNCDTNTATDFRPQSAPTPFKVPEYGVCPSSNATNVTSETAEPDSTEDSLTESEDVRFTQNTISTIQGIHSSSPKVDQTVRLEGIVTAVTADKNASGTTFYTFFVQDSGDGDPASSDAIAVFSGRKPPVVKVGDWVEINGTVTEFFGLTEIDDKGIDITVKRQDQTLFDPIALNATNRSAENLEGMLVSLQEAIVIGPTFDVDSGCGFSVVPVAAKLPIIRHSLGEDVSKIIPVLPNDDRDCDDLLPLKRGDRVYNLQGPLTWNFEEWKIIQSPNSPIRVEAGIPLPLPAKIKLKNGQFSLATLNLENHFDSVDDTGDESEPKPSAEHIQVREQKFVNLIAEWMECPTLIGIQEVETKALLVSLAKAIEPDCGFEYGVAHRESYDGRGIDNALLFNPTRVELIDHQLRQSCTSINTGINAQRFSCPAGQEPLFSRPPLEANLLVDDQPVTLFINHFKSKRGGEQETASRRMAQAKQLLNLVNARLAAGENRIAVVGDFNDYADSPTMQNLTDSKVLENVLRRLPANEQYSFNFGGASQLIDGVLLTADLAKSVEHIQIIHLNADYPDSYQLELDPNKIDFKATDHDPAIVIFTPFPPTQETSVDIQQVNESLGQSDQNIAEADQNVAKIEESKPLNPIFKRSWLIYLAPIAALLLSMFFVFIFGRKSR